MHRYWIREPGPRRELGQYVAFLRPEGRNCDTDGNSDCPEDANWTELTIINREDESERVDVDSRIERPLTLEIRSERPYLAARLAYALAVTTDGVLLSSATGPVIAPDSLVELMGDFDLKSALDRLLTVD